MSFDYTEVADNSLLPFGANGPLNLSASSDVFGFSSPLDISSIFEDGLTLGTLDLQALHVSTQGAVGGTNATRQFPTYSDGVIVPFFRPMTDAREVDGITNPGVFFDLDTVRDSVIVTWNGVTNTNTASLVYTFQLELRDRGDGDAEAIFRYADMPETSGTSYDIRIDTNQGDAVLNTRGFKGQFDIPLLAGPLRFLDQRGGNTGVGGVWQAKIVDGVPTFGVDATTDGTAGADTLVGSDLGNDLLRGFDGDDSLQGGRGNDTLEGGNGHDMLFAGLGDDSILGGSGNDFIYAGFGDDIIFGGLGDDTIRTDAGRDTVYAGAGDDLIELEGGRFGNLSSPNLVFGQDGNDTIMSGAGPDTIYGGAGDDTILVQRVSANTIDGGNGNDFILLRGSNMVAGGAGNDTIIGGAGSDSIVGQAGDDVLRGEGGRNVVRGGEGDDFIWAGTNGRSVAAGGEGADRFYHDGLGTDAVHHLLDYDADEGDWLIVDNANAATDLYELRAQTAIRPDGSLQITGDQLSLVHANYEAVEGADPVARTLFTFANGQAIDRVVLRLAEEGTGAVTELVFDLG